MSRYEYGCQGDFMNQIMNKLYEYGLHDTAITRIKTETNKIVFFFANGIYKLNNLGKELFLTEKCSLIITVDSNISLNVFNMIDVQSFSCKGRKFVDSENIETLVQNEKLEVHNVYYSCFNNTVLLDVYDSKESYLIRIENCKNIEYKFAV